MISTLFTRGRRVYTTASVLTLVVAGFHTYTTSRPIPPDFDGLVQGMQNAMVDMGMGMAPSIWDIDRSLAYTMSITLATMGLLGLVLAGTTEATSRVLSRTAAVMTAGCIVLTALYWIYKVPPPLTSFGILTLAWGIAQRTTRHA
jgi:hypothetical protein